MKARYLSSMITLCFVFGGASAPASADPLPTTAADFEQPGSQPGSLLDPIQNSTDCAACHGNYDDDVEPYTQWAGTMMAQALRDPIFHAGLAIAEQDAPFSGETCIRCHSPSGWIGGRSDPPDGSALTGDDFDGVNCHTCHRLVDPVVSPENPEIDAAILEALDLPPGDSPHTGQYVLDPEDRRRGPFDLGEEFFWHTWEHSPFHQESLLCSTCHDVSNPAFVRVGGAVPSVDDTYVLGALDEPHPTHEKIDEFPLERTFSEWSASAFGEGPVDMGGRFGGNLVAVSTCQDCHMPDATGVGANPLYFPEERDDLGLHTFAGANTWVPRAIARLDESQVLYGADEVSGVDPVIFEDAILRSHQLLEAASDLELSRDGDDLVVRIINESGHKLPTGYGEGKRMWIHVRFLDELGMPVLEHGAYDDATATLDAASTKVYEIKIGMDEELAESLGRVAGPSFHMVLSNKIYSDNRIPPRGYTFAAFEAVQAAPVQHAYADGQHWDDTSFPIPEGAARAEVEVYYQTTSKEYIEFLRDENVTNDTGQIAYDEWVACGMSAPALMDEDTIDLAPASPLDIYLTDTQPNYLPGGTFSVTINIKNTGTEPEPLTRGEIYALSPPMVDFLEVLYNGPPRSIQPGATLVYPYATRIPLVAPLGTYEMGARIYNGATLLDQASFEFIMGTVAVSP